MNPPGHLLSFVTNQVGDMVTIHLDLSGIDFLIEQLTGMREALADEDCPHIHFHSCEAGGQELSTALLQNQPAEVNHVSHVKIYGWNSTWAVQHGLRIQNHKD